jgi:hypothetical protein
LSPLLALCPLALTATHTLTPANALMVWIAGPAMPC